MNTKSLILFLFLGFSSCVEPPRTIDVDGGVTERFAFSVPSVGIMDSQTFEWIPTETSSFVTFCVAPPTTIALHHVDDGTQILAVQSDGCIIPQDGAFDDLILYAGHRYRLFAVANEPVVFTLRF